MTILQRLSITYYTQHIIRSMTKLNVMCYNVIPTYLPTYKTYTAPAGVESS